MGEPSYSVPEGVAHDVIVKECAALVRWGMGDPSGFLGICAPEVVYFDPGLLRRIDGLPALTEYYESMRGSVRFDRFQMLNPLVQAAGEAAILTFNYVSYAEDGEPSSWNCTEVDRRAGGTWENIQSHGSYTIARRV